MKLPSWILCSFMGISSLIALGCEVSDELLPQTEISTTSEEPAEEEPTPSATTAATTTTVAAAPPTPKAIARGRLRFIEGYRQGVDVAVREGKPMLVFFTAEWCTYCHQMAQEAFTDGRVVNLSERFVCVLVDADGEKDICQQFQVSGFPTVQFISPNGTLLNRVKAKVPANQLVGEMHSALQAVARTESSSNNWAR